ncbi:hypothetical protein [Streptomyces sp. NBC_00670]|jgi:hypothetical protein|uniref:hypothetical protein n=1 Tax=Streptomyces sp. NBC_00670 TaxID=2975804 RepID=UPI002E365C60|nr:hypothetical protein [Streptomyces sp. NBC_00670]
MFGLTTTRHLRAVEARWQQRYNDACTTAELDRRRLERAAARTTDNLRHRLTRVITALATARRDLASSDGALRRLAEQLVDERGRA